MHKTVRQVFQKTQTRRGLDCKRSQPSRTHRPKVNHRGGTKWIGSRRAKSMPVANSESQVLLHRLAFDDFFWVIPAERQVVIRIGAFVFDLLDVRKRLGCQLAHINFLVVRWFVLVAFMLKHSAIRSLSIANFSSVEMGERS